MSEQRQEFRVVIERNLGPTESRVQREERPIRTEEAARELARFWEGGTEHANGWVETRYVTDWTEIHQADRERRGADLDLADTPAVAALPAERGWGPDRRRG